MFKDYSKLDQKKKSELISAGTVSYAGLTAVERHLKDNKDEKEC